MPRPIRDMFLSLAVVAAGATWAFAQPGAGREDTAQPQQKVKPGQPGVPGGLGAGPGAFPGGAVGSGGGGGFPGGPRFDGKGRHKTMGMPTMPGGGGQPPAKSKLERMLEKALHNNPDIRLAEAKLQEAQAELNKVRLQVAQKAVSLHHAWATQKAVVDHEQRKIARVRDLFAKRAIAREEVEAAEENLAIAKAKLAEIEAQMPYVMGEQPLAGGPGGMHMMMGGPPGMLPGMGGIMGAGGGGMMGGTGGASMGGGAGMMGMMGASKAGAVEPDSAKRIRKVLETRVRVNYNKATVSMILEHLAKKVPGFSCRNLLHLSPNIQEVGLDLAFDYDLPVGAILEAIEDALLPGQVSFLVRDYGLVLMPRPLAPAGALSVGAFRRMVEKK
jgi:hypothetical protein